MGKTHILVQNVLKARRYKLNEGKFGWGGGGRHTCFQQLGQEAAPFGTEGVGTGEAAVAADDAEVGDAALHQIAGGFQASFACAEILAAGAADDRPTLRAKPPPHKQNGHPHPEMGAVPPPAGGSGFGLFSGSALYPHGVGLQRRRSGWQHPVPPRCHHPPLPRLTNCSIMETLSHVASLRLSPPSTSPW